MIIILFLVNKSFLSTSNITGNILRECSCKNVTMDSSTTTEINHCIETSMLNVQ